MSGAERSGYSTQHPVLGDARPSRHVIQALDEHGLTMVGMPRIYYREAVWNRLCGLPLEEIRDHLRRFRAELDEALQRRETAGAWAARQQAAVTKGEAAAYAIAFNDHIRCDERVLVAEVAERLIDWYGTEASRENWDWWRALTLYENPERFEDSTFDPYIGFDRATFTYAPPPLDEERRSRIGEAFSGAWSYAVRLVDDGRPDALKSWKDEVEAGIEEMTRLREADWRAYEEANRVLDEHDGNAFVGGKYADALQHRKNTTAWTSFRIASMQARAQAVRRVLLLHAVGENLRGDPPTMQDEPLIGEHPTWLDLDKTRRDKGLGRLVPFLAYTLLKSTRLRPALPEIARLWEEECRQHDDARAYLSRCKQSPIGLNSRSLAAYVTEAEEIIQRNGKKV